MGWSFDPGGEPNATLVGSSNGNNEDDPLTKEKLSIDNALMMGEEQVQMETTDKLKIEKLTPSLDAHQVFDGMPKWEISLEFEFGLPMLCNSSPFGVIMNPPHPIAPKLGSAKLYCTLQKWMLGNAWVVVNSEGEMLLFDPGVTWLTPLADEVDLWALLKSKMLVGSAEEQDDLKALEDKMKFRLQNLVTSKFTNLVEVLSKLATQGKMMTGYLSVLCFDPGGGLHASDNVAPSTNASKFTEIRKSSLQLSCAEIGVVFLGVFIPATGFHIGWNTKVGFGSDGFMLKTEGEDTMMSFHPTSMQKDQVLNVDNSILICTEKRDFVTRGSTTTTGIAHIRHMIGISMMLVFDKWGFVDEFPTTASRILSRYAIGTCLELNAYVRVITFDPRVQLFRAFPKPFLPELMLDDHVIYLTIRCGSLGCLSYCSCMNHSEKVNWNARIFFVHKDVGVVHYELLNCYDIKGSMISGFLEHKFPTLDKYSTDHASSLSSKLLLSSVANKEVWGLLVKAYLMIGVTFMEEWKSETEIVAIDKYLSNTLKSGKVKLDLLLELLQRKYAAGLAIIYYGNLFESLSRGLATCEFLRGIANTGLLVVSSSACVYSVALILFMPKLAIIYLVRIEFCHEQLLNSTPQPFSQGGVAEYVKAVIIKVDRCRSGDIGLFRSLHRARNVSYSSSLEENFPEEASISSF